jgi:hypothetical protein
MARKVQAGGESDLSFVEAQRLINANAGDKKGKKPDAAGVDWEKIRRLAGPPEQKPTGSFTLWEYARAMEITYDRAKVLLPELAQSGVLEEGKFKSNNGVIASYYRLKEGVK